MTVGDDFRSTNMAIQRTQDVRLANDCGREHFIVVWIVGDDGNDVFIAQLNQQRRRLDWAT
jgi:hypothetical protein